MSNRKIRTMKRVAGRVAIMSGPFLVLGARALPEKHSGLRALGTLVGGALTAFGLVREFVGKGDSWGS